MSDAARQTWDRIVAEIGAEAKRIGTQGSMEMASALFNGNAFVPYGPGQYTPTPEYEQHQEQHPEQTQVQEHEMGRER